MAAVTVPVTVPEFGQAGTPLGAFPVLSHKNTMIPPFTGRWAKWMCACVTALDNPE
jgi:hypothetical protein